MNPQYALRDLGTGTNRGHLSDGYDFSGKYLRSAAAKRNPVSQVSPHWPARAARKRHTGETPASVGKKECFARLFFPVSYIFRRTLCAVMVPYADGGTSAASCQVGNARLMLEISTKVKRQKFQPGEQRLILTMISNECSRGDCADCKQVYWLPEHGDRPVFCIHDCHHKGEKNGQTA